MPLPLGPSMTERMGSFAAISYLLCLHVYSFVPFIGLTCGLLLLCYYKEETKLLEACEGVLENPSPHP